MTADYTAQREVDAMFGGEGNFQDYWLDPVSWNDTRGGWQSAELPLRAMRYREVRSWTPEEDAVAALQGGNGRAGCARHALEIAPGERGAGIVGLSPLYAPVKAQAVARGRLTLEWERRFKK